MNFKLNGFIFPQVKNRSLMNLKLISVTPPFLGSNPAERVSCSSDSKNSSLHASWVRGSTPAHRVFMSVRLEKCVSPCILGRNSSDHAFTCPGPRWTRLTARRTPALMVATCVCENDFSFGQNMLCTFLSHFVRCFIPGFGSRELGFVPVRLEKSGCRGIWGPGLNSRQLDFVPVRLEKSGCPDICGPGFNSPLSVGK